MKKQLQGNLMLLLAALIWGVAFVFQSVGMAYVGPFTFQFVRFLLGGLVLLPVVWCMDRKSGLRGGYVSRWLDKKLLLTGLICGIFLFLANTMQQISLLYTSAGKAGFLTAMYIVLVPVMGLLFRRKVPARVWCGVVLAAAGLYLLSLGGQGQINKGDLYALTGAVAFACQMTAVDHLASGLDGVRLSCLQIFVCAILSGAAMLLREQPSLPAVASCWLPICYTGILSLAVGYTLQILSQQRTSTAVAALIMSTESVFAALAGWLVLQERLKVPELAGCALILTALILSQLPAKQKSRRSAGHTGCGSQFHI